MSAQTWDMGPRVNGKHQIITPSGEPWMARVVAECASFEDARIVRAAPELLAALKNCADAMHADNPADGWKEIIDAALAAIAKAEAR